jgi:imidazolonepropionase-like amidohydrolase
MLSHAFAALLTAAMLAQPSGTTPYAPPANGPRRADPSWIALRDCTLHPRPGETLEHATVVMRDGVVQAVIAGEGTPVPIGPRVVDSRGLHVYPAFIDAYVEVDAPAPAAGSPGLHWNSGVTPQRRALDGTGLDEAGASSLRSLGFGAAAISPRGGIFRGTSAVVSLAKPADDPSISKPPVYRADAYQACALETARSGYPGSLMGAIALVRQTLSDADYLDSLPDGPAKQAALQNDGCLLALSRRYDLSTPLVFDCQDELDELRVAKIAREFGRRVMLVGSGTEFRRLPAIARDNLPLIVPLAYPRQPDVSTLGKAEQVELRELMTWEQAPTNARRLARAGLTFALTSSKSRNRADFRENLRKAIVCGLGEDEALAALTTTPARLLMVEDQLGTVEVGKRANLLVTDGPVFAKDTKYRAIYIDGRLHDLNPAPEDLDGEWSVEIPGAAQAERSLVFEGSTITVRRNDKSVKASRVAIESGRVSYTFDHEPLDGTVGIFSATAAIERDADGRPVRLVGQGVRSNGQPYVWFATRKPRTLEGLWVSEFDQAGPDGSKRGAMLAFSHDGSLTLVGSIGDAGTKVEYTYDGTTLRYQIETTKVEAVINWRTDPPTMTGTVTTPDGTTFSWSAARRNATGRFKAAEADALAVPADDPGAATFEIRRDSASVIFPARVDAEGRRGRPSTLRGEDVKTEGATITFATDAKHFEQDGKATWTVRLFGDDFSAVASLPDGTTKTFKGSREPPRARDTEEDAWAKDIPETLPTPFGPCGFDSLPAQGRFVLKNATLWTNTEKGTLKNGTLVIADGRIAGVYAEGQAVPDTAGASVLDCAGRHITPGIIDAHSHTGISRGVNEGGQAVTAEVRIGDVTNPDATTWYWQLAGGVTSVLSLHGSANAIGGQSQTNKIRWGCEHPDDMHFEGAIAGIKFALGENPRGANSPRDPAATTLRYPQTRMGVEMLIRDRFVAAREYAERLRRARDSVSREGSDAAGGTGAVPYEPWYGAPGVVRRDLELEALAEVLEGTRLVHCHSYRQDEIVMLCMVARDFGFRIGTFQHILEGYKVADYVRDYSGGGSGFSDWWAYKVEVQDAIPHGLPLMALVGATVSFNSDSDELARRLNVEAGKAVKYVGLPEEEALKFVTLNPAKQLRIDHRVGTLEVGKDADVAVWSGHPLSSLSRCEMTFVDGRRLFSLEDDAVLRERNAKERTRLIQKILAESRSRDDRADSGSARPSGAPGGRRPGMRRPPTASDDWIDIESLDDQQAARLREYFLDLMNRGRTPNEPGVCGCGFTHW